MGLHADGSEGDRTDLEPLHDGFRGFDLVDGDGGALLRIEDVAQEEHPAIHIIGECAVVLGGSALRGGPERLDGLGAPAVPLPSLPVDVDPCILRHGIRAFDGGLVHGEILGGDVVEPYSAA